MKLCIKDCTVKLEDIKNSKKYTPKINYNKSTSILNTKNRKILKAKRKYYDVNNDNAIETGKDYKQNDYIEKANFHDHKKFKRSIDTSTAKKVMLPLTKRVIPRYSYEMFHKNIRFNFPLELYRPIERKMHENIDNVCYQYNPTTAYTYKYPIFQQTDNELAALMQFVSPVDLIHGQPACRVLKTYHFYALGNIVKSRLLSQNFKDLSIAALGLTHLPKYLPELLWKIGSLILESVKSNTPLISSFNTSIKPVMINHSDPEFLLSQAVKEIKTRKNVIEAYQLITPLIAVKPYFNHLYLNLFYGQLEYVLWKNELLVTKDIRKNDSYLSNWEEDDENQEEFKTADTSDSKLAYHGQRALQYLKSVEKRIGVMDNSLLNYAQLIYHYKGMNECIEMLRKHLTNNNDNPNSYRFLIQGIKKLQVETKSVNRTIETNLVNLLKSFAVRCPTNDSVKELILHYKENGKYREAIDLIMKRIDHKALRKSHFDWEQLHQVCRSNERPAKSYFLDLIRNRRGWVKLHFSWFLHRKDMNSKDIWHKDKLLNIKKDLWCETGIGDFAPDASSYVVDSYIKPPTYYITSEGIKIDMFVDISDNDIELQPVEKFCKTTFLNSTNRIPLNKVEYSTSYDTNNQNNLQKANFNSDYFKEEKFRDKRKQRLLNFENHSSDSELSSSSEKKFDILNNKIRKTPTSKRKRCTKYTNHENWNIKKEKYEIFDSSNKSISSSSSSSSEDEQSVMEKKVNKDYIQNYDSVSPVSSDSDTE